MFLKKFIIKNYRCIKEASIFFNRGVNIIIGENNSGKTSIIDALRVCLSYGKQKRDIWVSTSDFYIDKNIINTEKEEIEFHMYFEIEEDLETGVYYDFLSSDVGDNQELQLHFKYYLK